MDGMSKTKRLVAMNSTFDEMRRRTAEPEVPPAERAKERPSRPVEPPAKARLSSLQELGAAWRARQKEAAE